EIVFELVRFQVYGARHHKDRPRRSKYLVRVGSDYPVGPCQADPTPAWCHSDRRCSIPQNGFAWNVGAQLQLPHGITEVFLPCISFDGAARDQKLAVTE